ncbi:MAG: prepilin peptidase [Acidobacteriota bacterium]|nr:prepilin peptidase [Acidobacteriota bacterium]
MNVYPEWFIGSCYFIFGLIFGSFLNVCIYRLPRGLSVVAPRSACPGCSTPIAWHDNIPVLSWLALRGRCRQCRQPITPRYALVELVCGLLFLLSFLRMESPVDAVKSCVICFLLLGLTFTDAETHLLPDAMTLPGLFVAVVFSLFSLVPGPAFLYPIHVHGAPSAWDANLQLALRSLANSLLGAAAGAGILWGIGWVYQKLRDVEGMGLGDVKLMAMVGAFLGPVLTIFALCLASIAGGVFGCWVLLAVYVKRLKRYRPRLGRAAATRAARAAQTTLRALEIPFGVFLCMVSLIAWFYGPSMIRAYLHWMNFLR